MTRYATPVTLISSIPSQGDDGSVRIEREESVIFANPYSVGSNAWMAARSAGLHADAEIQVRTFDYSGQQIVEIEGVEYDVERVATSGDFTRLTLKKRLSNA